MTRTQQRAPVQFPQGYDGLARNAAMLDEQHAERTWNAPVD